MKWLLWPFAVLYDAITLLRNLGFRHGWFKTTYLAVFTLGVGNLRVGGTGKTPHIEYLIRLLSNTYSTATLSRGYGRNTKGFRIATTSDTAQTIGDEPLQFFEKFGSRIKVAVGEKRVPAGLQLVSLHPDIQLLLLDDAYQHRSIGRHLNILLSEYSQPFYEDFVLPMGRLRERRVEAQRADIVVITKCPPTLTATQRQEVCHKVTLYTQAPVFFSGIRYGQPIGFGSTSSIAHQVLLVSGIANPTDFERYAQQQHTLSDTWIYPDHHAYTRSDLEKMKAFVQSFGTSNVSILTTEKDYVKLAKLSEGVDLPIFYIPIEVYLLEKQQEFEEFVRNRVKEFYKTKALR
ncbi:MAG: tetraacyldisaccharide 4'-kinase [Spirosomataceae bacterium]